MTTRRWLQGMLLVLGVGLVGWQLHRHANDIESDAAAFPRRFEATDPSAAETLPTVQDGRVVAEKWERMLTMTKELGITNPAVLRAMGKVPRHTFLSPEFQFAAYDDRALPVEQFSIPHPFVCGYSIERLRVQSTDKVLVVADPVGYMASLIAEISRQVYLVLPPNPTPLPAKRHLDQLGHYDIKLHEGDPLNGWADNGPYDVILVATAVPNISTQLVNQLAPGGRMLTPVGHAFQDFVLHENRPEGLYRHPEDFHCCYSYINDIFPALHASLPAAK